MALIKEEGILRTGFGTDAEMVYMALPCLLFYLLVLNSLEH